MKTRPILIVVVLLVVFGSQATAGPLGSAFTYQGRLTNGGQPANGAYDVRFILYTADIGGSQVGPILTNVSTAVSNGLFTTTLDFGGSVFSDEARWLEIAVRPTGGGGFTPLNQRQPLMPAPQALYASQAGSAVIASSATAAATASSVPWAGITGMPAGFADGVDDGASFSAGTGLTLAGTTLSLNTNYTDGRYWKLGGNSGATPGTHFLGTADNQALELKVNNQRALRIVPNDTSPNIIGGYSGNVVSNGVVGATISGGGESYDINRVEMSYATVSGGKGNIASGWWSVVGGGAGNVASNDSSTIGGGLFNYVTGSTATVGGGYGNYVTGPFATISGGWVNTNIQDSATIGGGFMNTVTGISATVSGGMGNLAGGQEAVVSGGTGNRALQVADTVAGGQSNSALGGGSTVGGGAANFVSGALGTIAGGNFNTNSGSYATISGGRSNLATAAYAVIPGGFSNVASGTYSFAAGRRASAIHQGAFVWADSNSGSIASTNNNSMTFRASGGVRFFSNSGATAGVFLAPNSTSWSMISDRNVKKNFAPVDGETVLKKLSSMPVERWNYEWESDNATPHIGPMAQDFIAAFYPGRDDKSITTLEFDGVELAAIKAVNQKLETALREKDARIAQLEKRLEKLESLVLYQIGGDK